MVGLFFCPLVMYLFRSALSEAADVAHFGNIWYLKHLSFKAETHKIWS